MKCGALTAASPVALKASAAVADAASTPTPIARLRRSIPSMSARRVAVRDSPSETARLRAGPDLIGDTSFPEVGGFRWRATLRHGSVREQATSVLGPSFAGLFLRFSVCSSLFLQGTRSGGSGRRRAGPRPRRPSGGLSATQPVAPWPVAAGGLPRHTCPPMAVLVDELREYPGVALPYTRWCHMATDGPFEELHAFARRLGLRRAWFQGDHYDLPPLGRTRAVALGAEEVATEELLARMTGRAATARAGACSCPADARGSRARPVRASCASRPATSSSSVAPRARGSRRWRRVPSTSTACRSWTPTSCG